MFSFGKKSSSSKSEALNKRVPENPKYKHVGTVLDTGAAVRKSSSGRETKKVFHNEVFRRIRLSTLATLMVEVAKDVLDNRTDINESNEKQNQLKLKSYLNEDIFSLQSVITGVGEKDVRSGRFSSETDKKEPISLKDSPYLLLDVRDEDSYQLCHIITALHYPSSMLCRTCNYETKELLAYKNAPLRLIVLYDEDETIASRVATTLIQRGYDNVFMLSGGLKQAAEKFPQGFITGLVPESCRPQSSQKNAGSQSLPNVNQLSPRASHLQESFTRNDLDCLQSRLDTVSVHAGAMSSRSGRTMSVSCSSARVSQMSRNSTTVSQPRCVSSKPQHWR